MGFLDGSEAPDIAAYEEMLREAAEEVLALLQANPAPYFSLTFSGEGSAGTRKIT
jgi:hypothetical protein